MTDTTLADQVRSARNRLSLAIESAILDFQETTGIVVTEVKIRHLYQGGVVVLDSTRVYVYTEIEDKNG